jgi:hypothetical protein
MTIETNAAPAAPTAVATAVSALIDSTPAAAPAADVAAPAVNDAPAAAPAADAPPAEPVLKMPGKDATPEDWAAFYGQIGRPETPDAYELPLPEGDAGEFVKMAAPMLHKAGLTGEQAKTLATEWNSFVAAEQQKAAAAEAAGIAALDARNKAEKAELDNEWGVRNTENTEMARRAIRQFIPTEKAAGVINAIESVLGYKETVKFLHGIGKGLAEHDAAGLGNNSQGTPERSLADRMFPAMAK